MRYGHGMPCPYGSSTSNANNSNNAWSVDLWHGYVGYYDKSNFIIYVWPVRAGQFGSSGSLDYLVVTAPDGVTAIGPQAVGSAFPIKITAKDWYGNIVTNLNGSLTLSGSASSVKPMTVPMLNGVASPWVKVDRNGCNQTIRAYGLGGSGASQPFTVGAGGPATATLSGVVRDGTGVMMEGATVKLDDGTSPLTVKTNSNGEYRFTGLLPCHYTVSATDSSGGKSSDLPVDVSNEKPKIMNLTIWGSICNPTGRTPVLLVPGILGSSVADGGPYPVLPKGAPSCDYEEWENGSWGLHDPDKAAGWRDLLHDLVVNEGYEVGCTLFPAPYDWRKNIDSIAKDCLEKVITKAKSRAGSQKVNIVAHSMGGLVTRSYIQSGRYNKDIDKFAIVGTPNHGSANAYYLWQGGDPLTLDRGGDFMDRQLSFYTETVNNLHHSMTNKYLYTRIGVTEPWYFGYNEKKIRYFIQGEVKSAQQLMPTYAFLADNTHSFSLEKDPNNWLKDLNNDFDNTGMNGVNARIFTGDQTDTISIITVGKPNDRYVDGAPKKTYEISGGDGTVLATSIHLRNVDDAPLKKGKHSELINIYKNGIIAFLKEPAATTVTLPTTVKAAATALSLVAMAPNTRKLTVFIQGRVSPFLTDPSGKSSGINPLTRTLENRIPNTTVTSNLAMASVSIDNPQDGAYILTLFGSDVEDYGLSLSWIGPEQTTETRVIGFNSTGTKDVAFVVDSTKPEIVTTIGSTPQPPTSLQADAVGTSSLLTRLSWQARGEVGVIKYHIYSRYDDEPYLTKIGETVGTSFDTNHSWSGDAAVKLRIYAVSAVKADGSESFLSNFAENNDRDHDGLTDVEEATLGTDPTKVDTDGDGFNDSLEVLRGSNPTDKNSVPNAWLSVTLSGTGGGGAIAGETQEKVKITISDQRATHRVAPTCVTVGPIRYSSVNGGGLNMVCNGEQRRGEG